MNCDERPFPYTEKIFCDFRDNIAFTTTIFTKHSARLIWL